VRADAPDVEVGDAIVRAGLDRPLYAGADGGVVLRVEQHRAAVSHERTPLRGTLRGRPVMVMLPGCERFAVYRFQTKAPPTPLSPCRARFVHVVCHAPAARTSKAAKSVSGRMVQEVIDGGHPCNIPTSTTTIGMAAGAAIPQSGTAITSITCTMGICTIRKAER
jgi:hypothetical protein